jgi:sec-independent protein translocase protein TatA
MELVLILLVALIVLGPKKLPEVGRSVGRGMREFRDALSNPDSDDDEEDQRPAVGSSS